MSKRQPHVRSVTVIGSDYSATLGATGPQNLFLSKEWFDNFVETVAEPSGMTPLYLQADAPGNPMLALGIRSGVITSLSNFYSCGYGVGTIGAWPSAEAVRALVDALLEQPRRRPEIRLAPILEDEPSLAPLIAALDEAGWIIEKYICHANWSLPVAGRTYEEYFATLSPRMQNTIRRKRRSFLKDGGRLSILRGPQEVEAGLSAFQHVYAKSWKRPESFPRFIPGLCTKFAPLDIIRMGIAWFGDIPVAGQLWLNYRGQALVYKLAHDEQYRHLSVGTVLTAEMLRFAIDEDRVTLVDHLTGNDAYKRDWMTDHKTYYGISAYPPRSVTGVVARARKLYKRLLRGPQA